VEALTLRILAHYSKILVKRIKGALSKVPTCHLTADEKALLEAATAKYLGMDLFFRVHDGATHGTTLDAILASAQRIRYDAIFIDHLGMIAGARGTDKFRAIDSAVDALQALSRGKVIKDYRPFVVVTTPLNRDLARESDQKDGPRMPKISDFFGSSKIEYAADVAIALQRHDNAAEDPNPVVTMSAHVLKNREGPAPAVLQFEANGSICEILEKRKEEYQPTPSTWVERSEEDEP
jgi:replicative DNA helicase